MKTLMLLALIMPMGISAQMASCCKMSVSDQNSMLAMNEAFANAHLEPLPYKPEKAAGKMITFKAGDGKDASAYMVASDTPTKNVVFMFHEWWGLNDYIKEQADKLQKDLGNVTVYAIDLYDGQVASLQPEAQKLMSGLSDTRCRAIIDGVIMLVGKDAKIATIGWCMGGAWALQAAIQAGRMTVGCVMYYGMPEQDINRLKMLNSDVLGIFANEDKFINPDVVKGFQQNMEKAKKKLILHKYEADHAFANPSNPKHNKKLTEDAYAKALVYLKGKFKRV